MKLIILFLVLIGFILADDVFTPCGDTSKDLLQVNSIIIKPVPIVKGKSLFFSIQGVLKEQINDGNVEVKIKVGFVTVLHETYNLCNITKKCPFMQGDYSYISPSNATVPDKAISGTYEGFIKATSDKGEQITCYNFKVKCVSNGNEKSNYYLSPLDSPVNDQRVIDYLNIYKKGGWIAGRNHIFDGLTLDQVKKRFLGVKSIKRLFSMKKQTKKINYPDSFDWRNQDPKCVKPIRNQGQCGSCYAFGATESLSDRFCIASKGKVDVNLSPEYIVDCDFTDYGCQGGILQNVWEFIQNTGVPTEECYPYSAGSGEEGECKKTCKDGSPMVLYKATNVRDVVGADNIAEEILNNGPIEASFSVYQDFLYYTSGVYHHKSTSYLGGHAIKIIGWGKTDDNTPYWICANSWGETWGINGYFWILKNQDECGIESNGVTGDPLLN